MAMPKQRPGRSKQDYSTPDVFVEAVKHRLGIKRLSHDFAANTLNAKAPTHYDIKTDALSLSGEEWSWNCVERLNRWGWLNPPFAKIEPWAYRCAETKDAGGQIALLVPASVGSDWFRDYVDGIARVLFLNGRLAFMPNKPKWLYPKDCILCLYSDAIEPGYEVWNWRKS